MGAIVRWSTVAAASRQVSDMHWLSYQRRWTRHMSAPCEEINKAELEMAHRLLSVRRSGFHAHFTCEELAEDARIRFRGRTNSEISRGLAPGGFNTRGFLSTCPSFLTCIIDNNIMDIPPTNSYSSLPLLGQGVLDFPPALLKQTTLFSAVIIFPKYLLTYPRGHEHVWAFLLHLDAGCHQRRPDLPFTRIFSRNTALAALDRPSAARGSVAKCEGRTERTIRPKQTIPCRLHLVLRRPRSSFMRTRFTALRNSLALCRYLGLPFYNRAALQ